MSCIHMFYHLFPYVLAFPYLTHWMHLLTNCTTNPEGAVASFASKMYNLFSIWGNLSCIFFAPKYVSCNSMLGLSIHFFIWIRSIWFIYWMIVMASSFLVLELHWFLAMSIFPRASEILFPSTSSRPLSSEDISSRQALCTSLANIFLSAIFDSQAFKIMLRLVF
jgi:hypothetical protein